MNNFIQKIKLFYSQNYKEVYDEGELIDAKSLYPSQTWDFEISGLEECSEEEAYLEECEYSLKHYFNLEDVALLSPSPLTRRGVRGEVISLDSNR